MDQIMIQRDQNLTKIDLFRPKSSFPKFLEDFAWATQNQQEMNVLVPLSIITDPLISFSAANEWTQTREDFLRPKVGPGKHFQQYDFYSFSFLSNPHEALWKWKNQVKCSMAS